MISRVRLQSLRSHHRKKIERFRESWEEEQTAQDLTVAGGKRGSDASYTPFVAVKDIRTLQGPDPPAVVLDLSKKPNIESGTISSSTDSKATDYRYHPVTTQRTVPHQICDNSHIENDSGVSPILPPHKIKTEPLPKTDNVKESDEVEKQPKTQADEIQLTMSEKLAIIRKYEENSSFEQLGRIFKLDPHIIENIIEFKDVIVSSGTAASRKSKKNVQKLRIEHSLPLSIVVCEWIRRVIFYPKIILDYDILDSFKQACFVLRIKNFDPNREILKEFKKEYKLKEFDLENPEREFTHTDHRFRKPLKLITIAKELNRQYEEFLKENTEEKNFKTKHKFTLMGSRISHLQKFRSQLDQKFDDEIKRFRIDLKPKVTNYKEALDIIKQIEEYVMESAGPQALAVAYALESNFINKLKEEI